MSYDKADSEKWMSQKRPKIIISSSGFLTAGRSVEWCKRLLPDERNAIVLTGYAGSSRGFLSYRLKNARPHEAVKVNGQLIPCEAKIKALLTMSSHMPHDELLQYYGGNSFDCGKLVLCHGSEEAKVALKKDIEATREKNNRTYRVLLGTPGMLIRL